MTQVQPEQEAAVAFLGDGRSFGLAANAVRRIDTHAAHVFLAGERAYKIKRAVKYPYLDYSTLARREAACRAELEVNRRFAPALYLRVLPLVRGDGGRIALDGVGETIEWALEMRRFDDAATLDRVAAKSGIDDVLARALGEQVATAHRAAPAVEAAPWIEALAKYVADAGAAFAAAPESIAPAQAEALIAALRAALEGIRPLLVTRGEAGLVRQGHGDLHLRNVALIEGRPVLFDAIEFDPVIASGDVLYDLAFLLMDLLDRKLERAANIVLNRYLLAAGRDADLDALAALPLFLALRATIRARVALDKRRLAAGRERAECEAEARDYCALAARLIAPPAPRLVAIGGLSGTGKSALAADLAPFVLPAPGAVHLRSDIERKRLLGVAETERLPPAGYAPEVTARVYARLLELARRTLRAGHSALVDAVHARPDERAGIEAVAKEAGVVFGGLWLEADLEVRVARVAARRGDASDADARIAAEQEAFAIGAVAWKRIDAGGPLDQVTAAGRAALAL